MRAELTKVSQELENLSGLNLEMSRLIEYAHKFYNSCILKNDMKSNLYRLAEAKSHLLICLNIIKSIIESENNELINNFKNQNQVVYEDLDKYFENFLSSLDSHQKQLIKDIQNSDDNLLGSLTLPSSIKNFMEELKDGMENVVLYPLITSSKIYTEKDVENREKVVSTKEAFRYILFRQVLLSAKIKGSEKRQKVALSSQTFGATFQEHNIIKQGRSMQRPNMNEQPQEPNMNEQPQEPIKETDDFEDIFLGGEEI